MNRCLIVMSAVALLGGCASLQILDPASERTDIRREGTISSEEMREVARESVRSALTNAKFKAFERKFQTEKNDETAIPILKLAQVVNMTDDPNLNVSEMTDLICEELINSGKVDVTLAEGAGRAGAIAASRGIEEDDNFDQKTVAQRGTLQAARLVLRPKVVSNTVKDGGRKVVTRTFTMDMADIQTGLVMWKFTKQLGFMKTKGVVGW